MASSQVLTPTHEYPFAFAGPKPIMDPKERFYRQFQQEAVNIQEAIGQLSSIPKIGGERQDATDSILASISQLSNEVSDASDFVPAYDLRSYSQAVKALTDQLNEETAKLAPKTKFQFKPRAANITGVPKAGDDEFVPLPSVRGVPSGLAGPQPAADAQASSSIQSEKRDSVGALPSFPSKDYNAEMAKPGSSGVRKPSFSAARDVNISDHTGLHIILPSTASRATSSGSLTGLTGCVVDMSVPTAGQSAFAGLAIKSIAKSLIVAGHVNGPAHITGVSDSIVVVAARQVRIHECNNVDFYLHCGSRPIIEDCSGVRFAPIPACYLGEGVDPSTNQWDQVDDFKWLKAEHSPNWKILPAVERLAEEAWTKTVPGGPGVGTDDVLKKVGISSR